MNKSLLGFIIAGALAVIGFLIYWFFFRKQKSKANDVNPLLSPSVPNPITPQDTSNNLPAYVPVNPDILSGGEFGSSANGDSDGGYAFILSAGFYETPQEALESGTALSQRSNNPGALFWDGSTNWQGMDKPNTKSGQIIYFDTSDYGVRAHLMTLKNYYKKHGIDTLIGITTRYAPYGHGANNPAVYAQTLASCMGMNTTDRFNLDSNRKLLAAIGYYMHRVEAGYYWIPRSKYLEWSEKV